MEIISLLGEKIIIGSIYRHPKPNVHSFLNYLKTAPQKLEKKKKIILTGNFNRNIYKRSRRIYTIFSCAMVYTSNIRANKDKKHEKPILIENVFFINFQNLICTSSNFTKSVTDHLPNFLTIQNSSYTDSSRTLLESCWLVSDPCWLVLDSCWFTLTLSDSCWLVLIRVDSYRTHVDSYRTHVDSCETCVDSCVKLVLVRVDLCLNFVDLC